MMQNIAQVFIFYDRDGLVRPKIGESLYFFAGVNLGSKPHSKFPLNAHDSFAGWIMDHAMQRSKTYHYRKSADKSKQKYPFQASESQGQEKRSKENTMITACLIRPLREKPGVYPKMVLCVDCTLEDSMLSVYEAFADEMIASLCIAFSVAQASWASTTEILEYIKSQY